jgi:8-oxo-dGTP pyrophosphatase MutT (NUDIX family)
MHRQLFLDRISGYHSADKHEEKMRDQIEHFVRTHADCFERSLSVGHITGSAWVLDRTRTHVLLTHHRKLGRWLQLGGHADGEPDVLNVAQREAIEESGLKNMDPISEDLFDVDIHEIPEHKDEPKHLHYDIRFLFEADRGSPLRITGESNHLEWIPLENVARYTNEESMMRMVRKTFPWRNSANVGG